MFNIRVALAATALALGSAGVVSAQQQAAPEGVHQDHAQRPDSARRWMRGARGVRGQLFKGITLSAAEKANLKAVHAKYASQMKAIREQNKQVLQAERNDMRAALTPANQAKFDANVAAFDKKLAEHGKGGRRGLKPPKPLR